MMVTVSSPFNFTWRTVTESLVVIRETPPQAKFSGRPHSPSLAMGHAPLRHLGGTEGLHRFHYRWKLFEVLKAAKEKISVYAALPNCLHEINSSQQFGIHGIN